MRPAPSSPPKPTRAVHVTGSVIDSPSLRYLIELDDDAWQRLGEVRVGDLLLVMEGGETLRAEAFYDGERLGATWSAPLHERHVLVRRPFPEAA